MTFNELVRLLAANGYKLLKEHGSIRYYQRPGVDSLIRVDYHGSNRLRQGYGGPPKHYAKAEDLPTGTLHAIAKAAGLRIGGRS